LEISIRADEDTSRALAMKPGTAIATWTKMSRESSPDKSSPTISRKTETIQTELDSQKEIVKAFEEEEEEVRIIELEMDELRKRRETAKTKRIERVGVAKVYGMDVD
jgi:hypothetical protein